MTTQLEVLTDSLIVYLALERALQWFSCSGSDLWMH